MELIDNYYTRTQSHPITYPPLDGTVEADICVVGGGLAGLNTALGLIERGRSAVVIESGRIGCGASGRNGGFVAKGYAAGEGVLAEKLGEHQARALIDLTRTGRTLIRNRIRDHAIDCGPIVDGVLTVSWRDRSDKIRAKAESMNQRFGLDLEFWPRERVREHCRTEKYFDGIFSPGDFQFHPLNYLQGLARVITAKGGMVYEQTKAVRIEKTAGGFRVHTSSGIVTAQQVVLCCSIDINGLEPRLARAAFSVRTFITVTEPVPPDLLAKTINTPHAVYDMRFSSDYYRVLPDRRVMWGGRVSVKNDPLDIAQLLLGDMAKVYPALKGIRAEMAWSGRLCYAPHKMPQIGQLENGLWYNTCFGGHGLVPTTIGGEIIAAAIAQGGQSYKMFAPFGLGYAGGKLGPYVAQSVYYLWRARDIMGV